MKAASLLVVLGLWAAPVLAAVEVPLTVSEPVNVARRAGPVTSGIPLPPATDPAGPWALFDGSREMPVQVTPLSGRTPWILVDFQLDIGARKTKTLHLRDQAPSVQASVTTLTPPPTAVRVVDAASGQTWTGVVERQTWEYQGPMRSVLRVDGHYGDAPGFGYTTRYTFYSGRKTVRIEHALRNSLKGNERHLKLRSATLTVGEGAATARVESSGKPVVVRGGATVELLPTQQPGFREPKGKAAITVDQNGGYLLPDLTHYSATVIYDPAGEWTEAAPLMALAPARWYAEHGELTTRRFGTLDDEREMYRRWGWTWMAKQEPVVSTTPTGAVTLDRIDVHGDSEADDLWQNLLMFVRTGGYGYFVRAQEWAAYYAHEYAYRTDGFAYAWDGAGEDDRVARPTIAIPLTEADRRYLRAAHDGKVDVRSWGADHFYGWGLLDWYLLTGQRDAVDVAVDLGEISRRAHGQRQPQQKWRGGTRGIARHLLLTVRLWEVTQDQSWKAHADHLVKLILGSSGWQEAWGIYAFDSPLRVPTPFHVGLLSHALARYDEVIGHPEVRRRLIRMAEFARRHALHPKWGHAAKSLYLDCPAAGQIAYASDDGQWTDAAEPIVNPAHTFAWVDVLVRGYRLTGDRSFLDRAGLHWANASRTKFKSAATSRTVGSREVGHFANSKLGPGKQYFSLNGELPYVHLLFADAARQGAVATAPQAPAAQVTTPPAISATPPLADPSQCQKAARRRDREKRKGQHEGKQESKQERKEESRQESAQDEQAAVPVTPASTASLAQATSQPAAGPVSSTPAPWLETLGDNSWREASPPPRQVYESLVNAKVEADACKRTITSGDPISRTYTGLLADGQNTLFLFGGGHSSHPGNDVDLYRVDENRWEVQYEPECPLPGSREAGSIVGTGSGTASITALGRPYTEHTYQQMAYDPVRKRYVGILSSGRATWAYGPSGKQWRILAGPPAGTFSPNWYTSGGLVVYDPATDKIIAIVRAPRSGQRGVYQFDPTSNQWSFAASFPADVSLTGTNMYAAYNPDRREFYVLNYKTSDGASFSKLYRYVPAGHRWSEVGSLPPALRESSPMFDYDTRNRRVVFLIPPTRETKAAIWVWNPEGDAWEPLPTPSLAPMGNSTSRRSFVYVPAHNVFVFLQNLTNYCGDKGGGGCGGRSKTWVYRYKAAPEVKRQAGSISGGG